MQIYSLLSPSHYYGKEENNGKTIKTKPKQGTERFFVYTSIYMILKDE
ncbi:MAG: hypothetical protein LBR15_02545 [Methanobrevibacter sp.]|nr:hypothetical protein [Candidatus Methanovirga australis]